jgi:hypothetical protein
MSERFVATKKLTHLYNGGLVLIDCFQRCGELIYRKVNVDKLQFCSQRRVPAQLVRSLRPGDEEVATPHAAG